MPKTTMTLDAWKCYRCGYVWPNKREMKPLRCANPNCGSVYWDIPKRNEEEKQEDD